MFASDSRNMNNSWVIRLVLINIIIFLLQFVIAFFLHFRIEEIFGLNPMLVIKQFKIWQIFTYMFLHSPVNFFHILFNMYLLWIFGLPVEEEWGSKSFLSYYLFSGIGAGICILILNLFTAPWSLTIGASGAIFGLLLAFGVLYPNAEILLFFILPVKAKYLVLLYGGLEFYLMFSSTGDNISHIGHLGGLLFGFIYFLIFKRGYIIKSSKGKKNLEIIGEIKKKVEEIKDKTTKQAQAETVKNAIFIKDKLKKIKSKDLDEKEKKILDMLNTTNTKEEKMNICKKKDFSTDDNYCQDCEYFNTCLHRSVTGIDPLEDNK